MPSSSIAWCDECPYREVPEGGVVAGTGPASASILLLGEAPGAYEVRAGVPFQGAAGSNLNVVMDAAGLRRDEVYLTNVVACRPEGNARPRRTARKACSSRLRAEIERVDPQVIVTLGVTAMRAVLPGSRSIHLARETAHDVDGRAVIPTYHPSPLSLNRSKNRCEDLRADLVRAVGVAIARE